MDPMPGLQPERQLEFLRDLEEENAWIARDILPMGEGLWGIHGNIAVDGEVLMGEFQSYEDARRIRDELDAGHLAERRMPPDSMLGPST